MSLSSSLHIGRTGLLASQAALDVAGNNLANVATRGYHRQTVALAPAGESELRTGVFIGRGVQIQQILRQVDNALEARLRGSISDQASSMARADVLRQVEALHNELSDADLSSYLDAFYNSWSELANSPEDFSVRTVVLQQAQTLADFVRNLRSDLVKLRDQVDRSIDGAAVAVQDILTRLEHINTQIATNERGSGGAHSLRDQRDILLAELSQYLDISTVEQPNGHVDVFVGSLPLVLNGRSRGIEVDTRTINGELVTKVRIAADGSELPTTSGKLGALIASRESDVNHAIQTLDEFTGHLIYEVNRLHSQGQGTAGFASVTSDNRVMNVAAALNSDAAGLAFTPGHGSFQIHVTQKSTGQRSTSTIAIDLDGIGGNDTTLNSLAAAIGAVDNATAQITSDGRVTIAAITGDFEITFSDDSSGVLAALGINTFFSGSSAKDVTVNATLKRTPDLIAAGAHHAAGDNATSLAIANLRTQGLERLGGASLSNFWARHIEDFAVRLAQANQQVMADTLVRENLESQQQSLSGVNADEEAINLLTAQRAFQASARFLAIVDELMKTLINLL